MWGGGGGGNTLVLWLTLLAFAAAAILATNFPQPAQAQSDDTARRIVARLLDDGRVEFGWQPTGSERVLPRQRYFPTNAQVDRWLRSSPVEVDGVEIGRINARLLADGRIEFGFTPTDGERILTRARYFPTNAQAGRWLRSTEITISLAEDAPGFTAVSAGGGHTCGLRNTGEIECWGDNEHGQSDAPEGVFTAVSTGWSHTCAIRESGAIECWGNNEIVTGWDEDYNPIWGYGGQSAPPPGNSYTTVSAGYAHTCAIRESGESECWGDDGNGQSDASEGNFTAISARWNHTCAIRTSGEIACWGYNEYGQTDAPAGAFATVSAGNGHTCAIRESGAIECWGRNEILIGWDGEHNPIWGYGGQSDPPPGNSYTTVSAGYAHTCAIRESGESECWGDNERGQSEIPNGSDYTAVGAGYAHTCAIHKRGAIECWGDNEHGQSDTPVQPDGPTRFTAVSAGSYHACGLRENGAIECWGSVRSRHPGSYIAVSAGGGHTCVIRNTGEIACWGRWNVEGQIDAPEGSFRALSAGWDHTCAIRDTGMIACWGSNKDGFGNEAGQSDAPAGTFTAVSAGPSDTCAIRDTGEIACWGSESYRTLDAEGNETTHSSGQNNPPEGNFVAVTNGSLYNCAIHDTGGIACWGHDNDASQPPTRAGSFTAVSAGYAHTCGLRTNGEIACWGRNDAGQSGLVAGTFTAVSSGTDYTCGVRDDGSIECWGRNDHGQTDAPAP